MATPRKRYRVDVLPRGDGTYHPLIRARPGELPDVWCPHHVRATSNTSAKQKAIQAHKRACEGAAYGPTPS